MTNLSKRSFIKAGALASVGVLTVGAGRCGADKVSIYVRTITTFLNQISGVLPNQAAFIARIVKIAADFDAAYKRGDFASADTFFNSLEQNLTTLTNSIGVNVSNSVKTWISIIGITVTSIAVLFKEQVDAQPDLAVAVRRGARSAGAVERLAAQARVDALYQASKP